MFHSQPTNHFAFRRSSCIQLPFLWPVLLDSMKYSVLLFVMTFSTTTVSANPLLQSKQAAPQISAPINASIGLNKVDLLIQYLGTASGGDGSAEYRRVTRAMGKKAIIDAHNIGLKYLRVAVAGYAPITYGQRGDLDL